MDNLSAMTVPNKLVAAAIIRDGKKVLIARRGPNMKMAGLWEFPGGKVEIGESPEECLKRELIEELSIETEIGKLLCYSDYEYDHGSFRILAYESRLLAGHPTVNEHDELAFVLPEQLLSFKLLPADIPIAQHVAFHTT